MDAPLFYLGTPEPSWLWRCVHMPLFVSRTRLARRAGFRRATTPWALDSGGYTEITEHGSWDRISEGHYVASVARFDREIGGMEWAAPMDWMCEPQALAATGLGIGEHQRRTVDNYPRLVELWPQYSDGTCPFVPVLQGGDHVACIEMYAAAGVDLFAVPLVGIGSVCRLSGTDEIVDVVAGIAEALPGVPLHGFGMKAGGLDRVGHLLASADSQAWSLGARKRDVRTPECTHASPKCTWCPRAAMAWRSELAGTATCARFVEHGAPSWWPRARAAVA